MAVPKSSITDAELSILNVIWNEGPLTARQITERVYEEVHVSSIGTVQKLISRLEEKRLVRRDRSRSVHQFTAAVTREDVAGIQLMECAEKLSEGSLSPFVLHLVRSKRLSKEEKAEIKRLLSEQ